MREGCGLSLDSSTSEPAAVPLVVPSRWSLFWPRARSSVNIHSVSEHISDDLAMVWCMYMHVLFTLYKGEFFVHTRMCVFTSHMRGGGVLPVNHAVNSHNCQLRARESTVHSIYYSSIRVMVLSI